MSEHDEAKSGMAIVTLMNVSRRYRFDFFVVRHPWAAFRYPLEPAYVQRLLVTVLRSLHSELLVPVDKSFGLSRLVLVFYPRF
jgi:hypothetical protein